MTGGSLTDVTRADAGNYRHPFVDNMWEAYRSSVGDVDVIFINGFE